jgi:hypothetical protein
MGRRKPASCRHGLSTIPNSRNPLKLLSSLLFEPADQPDWLAVDSGFFRNRDDDLLRRGFLT